MSGNPHWNRRGRPVPFGASLRAALRERLQRMAADGYQNQAYDQCDPGEETQKQDGHDTTS